MSAVTSCTLRVSIAALQAAIDSVVVHSEKQKQGAEQAVMCRVRLTATEGELLVGATDGRTAALAAVRIIEDSRTYPLPLDDGPFVVDLYPKQARQIADFVTPVKDDGELTGDAELELGLESVTIVDLSGKYKGTEATVPTVAVETTDGTNAGFPDLVAMIGAALGAASGIYKPLAPAPGMLARFEVAAKAYAVEPVIEPTGAAGERGFVVLVGSAFAGTIESRHGDDNSLRRRERQRQAHLARLGLLTPEQRARLELGGAEDPDGFFVADDVEDDEDAGDRAEARELSLVPSGADA